MRVYHKKRNISEQIANAVLDAEERGLKIDRIEISRSEYNDLKVEFPYPLRSLDVKENRFIGSMWGVNIFLKDDQE